MTDEPPEIPSDGDSPTYFDGKPGEPPSAPSLPSDERPTLFDDEARRLLDPGTELPPDLAAEHRAVYLRRGDLVANRFQVVKLLGFGGMGAVYHVKDRELHGQDRALKVMLPSLLRSDTARERFLSEVSISQKLNHDGIVRVHDLGLDSGRGFRFFTMEYVPGKTLNRLLKERGGKLPVDEALDITRQLCDALEYAHQHTVHRDLKPQNVMVQPDGRTKVLDFGLAKLMSPGRMTRSSMALGTAYYQAPEQSVHLSELDQRADIYSLGVMLYQMLTAQIPLGRVKPPSAAVPRLSKALDDVTLKCIEPQPNDRYDTVADLRARLDLVARPKRRGVMAAILAVLILAAAGLATYRFVLTQPPQPTAPPQIATAPRPGPPAPEGAPDDTGTTPKLPVPPGEGEAPSEPSRPTVTASDASAAKIAAQKAQKAALSAGAETHATELLADARKLLKEGEAHDTLEAFPEAIAKYGKAETAFGNAEQQAAAIAAEIAAVEAAQSAMDRAKQEADAVEAKTWAKVRYDQAAKLDEEARTALSISDRLAAAGLFNQAAKRYGLAVSEAKEYGEAMLAAARNAAAKAKQGAQTDDVKHYASAELAEADGVMDEAQAAGSDYPRAKGLYEKAAAKYAEALSVTPGRKQAEEQRIAAEKEAEAERMAQLKAAMETARAAAFTAKNKIGADERKHAAEEVKTGDDAWTAAEAAATDYAEAERQFKLAKSSYEDAVRVTPERIKAAQGPQPGEAYTEDLGDGVTLEMVWIPPGEFMMGSKLSAAEVARKYGGEAKYFEDEVPRHKVTLTEGFWLGKYEVTNAQYRRHDSGHSSGEYKGHSMDGADQPVVMVSWDDAAAFCKWLSQETGRSYALPSEAQWEYACRAGTDTVRYWGDDDESMGRYANVADSTAKSEWSDWTIAETTDGFKVSAPVGRYKPNAFGLYDMIGNVWEWCADWYDEDYYGSSPSKNPTGPTSGSLRVNRGGCWDYSPGGCRAAYRGRDAPGGRGGILGFRLAAPPPVR